MTNKLPPVSTSPSLQGASAVFLRDVLHGLSQPEKRLPCKYFYDQAGGELFERICGLAEYYPTRCELDILERHAPAIAEEMGTGVALIEYGSGSSRKTRLLLDQLRDPAAYLPVEINGEQLKQTVQNLAPLYPHLEVCPVEADFTRPFTLPNLNRPASRRIVYFSGSTIGNFEPTVVRELLAHIAGLCGPRGGLLIGVDLKKNPRILNAAYNDSLGVTAAFNLNILARINRELGADFAPDRYDHYAFYNPVPGRVEIHLLSKTSQTVHLGGTAIGLGDGESIRTEYSYKYSLEDCARLAHDAGLRVRQVWQDKDKLFSVQFWSNESGVQAGG